MKKNNSESEINRIRVKLYEETKNLTPEEHTRRSNENARRLAAQYGFIVSTKEIEGVIKNKAGM